MTKTAAQGATPRKPEPIELLDRPAVLKFFGGSRPLHQSTLYRGLLDGTYPRPINVANGAVRWVKSECEETLRRMIAARYEPKPQPIGRGRPRRRRIIPDNT
jgi:predicted DNA-binding transcriptional regulator AlpA